LSSHSTNKGLIFRIYKELKSWTPKEQTIQWINEMNWAHSSKRKYEWLINIWENFSTCLATQERYIDTILRSISSQSQWKLSRKQRTTNSSKHVEKRILHKMLLNVDKYHAYTFTWNLNKCLSYTLIGSIYFIPLLLGIWRSATTIEINMEANKKRNNERI
jgi:hypothetical protein